MIRKILIVHTMIRNEWRIGYQNKEYLRIVQKDEEYLRIVYKDKEQTRIIVRIYRLRIGNAMLSKKWRTGYCDKK